MIEPPKFQYGQVVHHTTVDRKGIVARVVWGPPGGWYYALIESDGQQPECGGYPEDILSGEPLPPGSRPVRRVAVDFSSFHKWQGEAAKMLPPEEGFGFQPVTDHFNAMTMSYNRLIQAIEDYCKVTALPMPW